MHDPGVKVALMTCDHKGEIPGPHDAGGKRISRDKPAFQHQIPHPDGGKNIGVLFHIYPSFPFDAQHREPQENPSATLFYYKLRCEVYVFGPFFVEAILVSTASSKDTFLPIVYLFCLPFCDL